MQNPVYTLLTYTPNYSKYLGGGETERGDDSDLQVEVFYPAYCEDYESALIDSWARSKANYICRDSFWEHRAEPQITLLIDGLLEEAESDMLEGSALEERQALRQRLSEAVAARLEELLQPWYAKQREAQRKAEAEELARQEATRQAELQELARLQTKYKTS